MEAIYKAVLLASEKDMANTCIQCLLDYRQGRFEKSITTAISMAQRTVEIHPEFSWLLADFAAKTIAEIDESKSMPVEAKMPVIAALLDISAKNNHVTSQIAGAAVYLAWGHLVNSKQMMQSIELGRDFIIANGCESRKIQVNS